MSSVYCRDISCVRLRSGAKQDEMRHTNAAAFANLSMSTFDSWRGSRSSWSRDLKLMRQLLHDILIWRWVYKLFNVMAVPVIFKSTWSIEMQFAAAPLCGLLYFLFNDSYGETLRGVLRLLLVLLCSHFLTTKPHGATWLFLAQFALISSPYN